MLAWFYPSRPVVEFYVGPGGGGLGAVVLTQILGWFHPHPERFNCLWCSFTFNLLHAHTKTKKYTLIAKLNSCWVLYSSANL